MAGPWEQYAPSATAATPSAPAAASAGPWNQYAAPAAPAPVTTPTLQQPRSLGRAAGDLGIGVGEGAVSATMAIPQLANTLAGGAVDRYVWKPVTGAVDSLLGGPGEGRTLAESSQDTRAFLDESKSPQLRQAEQDLADTKGFLPSAKKILTNPMLLSQQVAEQVPQFLVPAGAARTVGARVLEKAGAEALAKGTAKRVAAGMGAEEAAQLAMPAAQRLGERAASKAAGRAVMATGGAIGASQASEQAQQEVMGLDQKVLDANPQYQQLRAQGMNDADARRELAITAGMKAAAVALPLDTLASGLTARLEGNIFRGETGVNGVGQLLTRRGLTGVAKTAGKEGAEETLQEGGEQFGQNVGVQGVDPNKSLMDQVPEQAALGGTIGAVLGAGGFAGSAALSRPHARAVPNPGAAPGTLSDAANVLQQPAAGPVGRAAQEAVRSGATAAAQAGQAAAAPAAPVAEPAASAPAAEAAAPNPAPAPGMPPWADPTTGELSAPTKGQLTTALADHILQTYQQAGHMRINTQTVADAWGVPKADVARVRQRATKMATDQIAAAERAAMNPPAAPQDGQADQQDQAAEPAAAPSEPGTTASIPFMITGAMKADLRAAGYTADDIAKMTPAQANEALRATTDQPTTGASTNEPASEPAPAAPTGAGAETAGAADAQPAANGDAPGSAAAAEPVANGATAVAGDGAATDAGDTLTPNATTQENANATAKPGAVPQGDGAAAGDRGAAATGGSIEQGAEGGARGEAQGVAGEAPAQEAAAPRAAAGKAAAVEPPPAAVAPPAEKTPRAAKAAGGAKGGGSAPVSHVHVALQQIVGGGQPEQVLAQADAPTVRAVAKALGRKFSDKAPTSTIIAKLGADRAETMTKAAAALVKLGVEKASSAPALAPAPVTTPPATLSQAARKAETLRVKTPDGEMNGRTHINQLVKRGFTQLASTRSGDKMVHTLSNAAGESQPIHARQLDYAREVAAKAAPDTETAARHARLQQAMRSGAVLVDAGNRFAGNLDPATPVRDVRVVKGIDTRLVKRATDQGETRYDVVAKETGSHVGSATTQKGAIANARERTRADGGKSLRERIAADKAGLDERIAKFREYAGMQEQGLPPESKVRLEGTPEYAAEQALRAQLAEQVDALSNDEAQVGARAIGASKTSELRDPHAYILKQHPDDIREALVAAKKASTTTEVTTETPPQGGVSDSPDSKVVASTGETTKAAPQAAAADQGVANTKDAGEELWANRRNSTGKGLVWNDIAELNDTLKAREAVKSKVWPRPNYGELVEGGMPAPIAHVIKQMYDALATKPQTRGTPTDAQYQDYITAVQRLRDAAFDWARQVMETTSGMDDKAAASVREVASKGGIDPAHAAVITSALRLAQGRNYPVLDAVFPMPKKEDSRDPSRFRTGEQGKANNALGILLGGNKFANALQVGERSMRAAFKAVEGGWPAAKSGWEISFTIHQATGAKPEFFVVRKGTRRVVADGLATRAEAEAAAQAAYARLRTSGGDGAKAEAPVELQDARRGPARRLANEDVTSDQLRETFGFKGINFGNWMKGGGAKNAAERQAHLNHAYDAFHDLAEIMDLPPKAMSLNGTLGLAFGAQGSGGKRAAAAHFIPGVNEINLTREQGAGSLAHEWAHALDHYFAVQAGGLAASEQPFLTEQASRGGAGVRPEVRTAFLKIVQAMTTREQTAQEQAEELNRYQQRGRDGVEQVLRTARQAIERNGKGDTTAALAQFDELAKRLRVGDVGEGYVKTGKGRLDSAPQVVAQVANLVKETTGRKPDWTQALASYARMVSGAVAAKSDNAERAARVPSDFVKEARKLEGTRKTPYWSTKLEMFARAFQSYVLDKLAAEGSRNHYLTRQQMSGEDFARLKADPETAPLMEAGDRYPRGAERMAINKAFDTLVGELKTRDGEDGRVVLFSRDSTEKAKPALLAPQSGIEPTPGQDRNVGQADSGTDATRTPQEFKQQAFRRGPDAPAASTTADQAAHTAKIKAITDDLRAHWQGDDVPRVVVVATPEHLPDSAKVDQAGRPDSSYKNASGMYDGRTVWIVASKHPDTPAGRAKIASTLAHEVVGHYGVERIITREFGDGAWRTVEANFDRLRRDQSLGSPAMRSVLDSVERRYRTPGGTPADASTFAREALAVMAERGVKNGLLDRALTALRRFIRRFFPSLHLGEQELRQLLVRSKEFIERGQTQQQRVQSRAALAFSSDVARVTDTPAFREWFGTSKVVNTNGDPLVVYHGTAANVSSFESKSGAFYFTDNPSLAADYASAAALQNGGDNVVPVYLTIKQPMQVDFYDQEITLPNGRVEEFKGDPRAWQNNPSLVARAKKEGADGIIMWGAMDNAYEGQRVEPGQVYIAFAPEQIKSATGNRGTFDAADPRINFNRDGWDGTLPDVVTAHRPGPVRNHADYAAAKAGDAAAALRLARDMVTPEFVESVRAALPPGSDPLIVPVVAREAAGDNEIPRMAAEVLAQRLGLQTDTGIMQVDKVSRGGADAMHRLANQPGFAGDVEIGRDYVLLDDALTQGGTLAQLKTHIEREGGRVVLATALTGKDYSRKLSLDAQTLEKVRGRFGSIEGWWKQEFGHGFDGLTESEARAILTFDNGRLSPLGLRNRVLAGKIPEVGRMGEAATGNRPNAAAPGTGRRLTDAAAFREFFGDSKVVDAAGNPLPVFHGTADEFDTFDTQRSGSATAHMTANLGTFFAEDRAKAQHYAENASGGVPAEERVVDAYLSIQKPYTMSLKQFMGIGSREQSQALREKLMQEGYDGIHIPEVKQWVAFHANQIKSASENRGTFDRRTGNIYFSRDDADPDNPAPKPRPFGDASASIETIHDTLPEIDRSTFQKGKDWIAGKARDFEPLALGGLQLRHVLELAAEDPTLKGPAKSYADLYQRMDGDRNNLTIGGAAKVDALQKWARAPGAAGWLQGKVRPEAVALFKFMHQVTQLAVDPTSQYEKLLMRDSGGEYKPWTKELIKQRIEVLRDVMRGRPGDDKTPFMDEIKDLRNLPKRERYRQAKYPQLVAQWNALSPEAKEHFVVMRDHYREQSAALEEATLKQINSLDIPDQNKRAAAQLVQRNFADAKVDGVYFPLSRFGDYWISAHTKDGEYVFAKYENAAQFAEAEKRFLAAGATIEARGRQDNNYRAKDAPSGTFIGDLMGVLKNAPEQVKDEIYQMYLKTLPNLSLRKHGIHRKNIAGYTDDVPRAFASSVFHGAHQLSKARYGWQLKNTLEQMQERMEARRTVIDASQAAHGDALLGELARRHDWIMNPTNNQLANKMTSIGFSYFLAASPASALVNLIQVPQIVLPVLGAQHGWGRATRMLSAAMRDAIRTGGHIDRVLTGEDLLAFKALQQQGTFQRSATHALAGISEGDQLRSSPAYTKVLNAVSWMFHTSEVINREGTGMAAFRLARAKGQSFEAAVKYADEMTNGTHGDYSNANRARYMQGNVQKVVLQFKNYSLAMSWLWGRNFYKAFKGESPEVKALARRTLTGMLGMTGLFAGVIGMPIFNLLRYGAQALHAATGDDDEPWDFVTEFRSWLAEHLGQHTAEMIADGAVSQLGANVASRVSMSDLWFRDADKQLEGVDAYHAMLESIAGPLGGMVKNMYIGSQQFNEGHTWRGIETMLPTFAKNAMKAARFATQGVNTLRGDPIVPDVSVPQALIQAIGFQPTKVAEQQRINSALMNYQTFIQDRRQQLLNAFAMAEQAGDADGRAETLQRIQSFNAKYPEIAIGIKTLRRSLRTRAERSAQAENGMMLNRKLAGRVRDEVGAMAGE